MASRASRGPLLSKSRGLEWICRERERENSNSKTLFYKECSLGSVKNLTASPCETERERERERTGFMKQKKKVNVFEVIIIDALHELERFRILKIPP